MKINVVQNPLSFKKTLVANTAYIKDNKICPAKIYKLNPVKDKNYFVDLEKKDEWVLNNYLYYLNEEIMEEVKQVENNSNYHREFFVMEDDDDECISVLSLETDNYRNETNGGFFEVRTDLSTECKNRNAKYIGESFILFVVKWSNDVLGTNFVINLPSATARDFYDKCGFKNISDGFYFPKENIDGLIEQNKSHTGIGVNFLRH